MTSDIDYYRKRAVEEQAAAHKAACPTARNIHEELAAAYQFRVSMMSLPATVKERIAAVSSVLAPHGADPGTVCRER